MDRKNDIFTDVIKVNLCIFEKKKRKTLLNQLMSFVQHRTL